MPLANRVFGCATESIHGVVVDDPYRWLEDRGLPETQTWVSQQQARCEDYFAHCEHLSVVRERVQEYLDTDGIDQPARIGDRYFYRRRERGQEQGSIFVSSRDRKNQVLLVDPSSHGPFVSVAIHRISVDGSLLAYERRDGGEDRTSIHVVDVVTGSDLPVAVPRGRARGFTFANDNRGFYFCHETPEDNGEHVVRYQPLYDSAPNRVVFRVSRSPKSRLLLLADSHHLGALRIQVISGQRVQDLWLATHENDNDWRQVFLGRSLSISPLLVDGQLFVISCDGTSQGEIVELDECGNSLRTIVPAQGLSASRLVFAGKSVFTQYLDCEDQTIHRWSKQGRRLPEIEVPADGTVRLLPHFGTSESVFYSYESFTQPVTIYEYNLASRTSGIWHEHPLSCNSRETFVQRRMYCSEDGTQIPLTLVSRRSVSKSSPAPVIMTTYGGFGIAVTPRFSVLASILMECGVIIALPHVRGGGEFGRAWHHSARGQRKQATFDDFISAADWLVGEGLTEPKQLGIFGGSNSGLLVGVALTQRPDLFRAVLCISPLLDMVRYETLDKAERWREEYGSCDNRDEFQALLSYSPYHHVSRNVFYPSVLFVTGDKDERCNPAHVRKMAARLLEEPRQDHPVLVDYSDFRGHTPALPLRTRIDALARRLIFFIRELNLSFN